MNSYYSLSDHEKKIAVVRHFQQHPEDYVREILGVDPDTHQLDLLRAVARPNARVCVVGANGMGKDAAVGWLPEWFLYSFGGPKGKEALVPTTSASGRQIDTLWREVIGWSAASKARDAFDPLVRELRLKDCEVYGERMALTHNKSLGFKAANAATMESFHAPHMLYIMTEARACEDWAYLAMFKACSGQDNRIVIQSVPGEEIGEFFKIASGQRPGWTVLHWPAAKKYFECPECKSEQETEGKCGSCAYDDTIKKFRPTSRLVTQESINEKLAYGEDSEWFQGPVLANFLSGSSLALVTLSEYMDAVSRYGEDGILESEPDILGVDWAWTGQNFHVMCHRRGQVVYKFWSWQGHKGNEEQERRDVLYTAERVVEWMLAWPHGVVVTEAVGAGAGLIDFVVKHNLAHRLIQVYPGNPPVGGPTAEEHFFDRRSQLYYYLKERFKIGKIAIKDKDLPLGGQLTSIRAKVRGDSKFQVEPKTEMLKRMPSPDHADALMLTMAGSPEYGNEPTIGVIAVAGQESSFKNAEW